MKEPRQFLAIVDLINKYNNDQPLHRYLNQYYRDHKQMGSRDRRLFSDWIFNFYRLGKALPDSEIETKLTIANFLIHQQGSDLLNYSVENYSLFNAAYVVKTIPDKIKIIQDSYPFVINDLFPFGEVSNDLDKIAFAMSLLRQPSVWIRVNKSFINDVRNELTDLDIPITQHAEQPLAWSIPQRTKLDKLKTFQQGCFEIQDISSQLTGNFYHPQQHEQWYDCCAASGGKSLLLHSLEPSIRLTVSDNRSSILENLKERFTRSGIKHFQALVADVADGIPDTLRNQQFDGIIVDAPCSGSGTWARTPEQVSFFNAEKLSYYQQLQQSIIKNMIPLLKPGKPLIYSTCSVFKQENEEQVSFAESMGLIMEQQQLLIGYQHKSDTLFVSRMIKPENTL